VRAKRQLGVLLIFSFLTSVLIVDLSFSSNGDLELHDVDPVQVVWDQPALIISKASALRVMVYSSFSSRVWAEINVTYDFGRQSYLETGPMGTGVPINPGYNWVWIPGGPVYPASDYPDPWIPSGTPPWLFWTKTGTDDVIQAEIDPFGRIEEADETNNLLTYPAVEVILPRSLRILLAPLADGYSHIDIPRSAIDRNLAFLKETFPLTEISLSWTMRDQVCGHPSHYDFDITESFYEEVVQDLSVEARVLGYDRLAVLYKWGVMGGCAVGILRQPEDRVPVVVSTSGLSYGEDLLAHEIGHTYYLWHPFDIGPPIYSAVRYSPIRRDYERVVDTFMDYNTQDPWIDSGRFQSDSKTWIDLGETGTWQWNLWEQLTVDAIRVPVMVISGWIFKSGGAIFNRDWYHIPKGVPDLLPHAGAPQQGNYTISLLDEYQQVLSHMAFNASFTYYVVPENHTIIEKDTDKMPFTFNIPYVNGTKLVQIRNATGFLLGEKGVSDNAPTVNVSYPDGGEELEIGNNYTVTWEANDLDGDELHYILSYSRDEGETWIPLASELNQTSFVWNTSTLLAGDTYLIKVMATDGVNTGEDQSNNTFTTLDSILPVIADITQDPSPDAVPPDQNVTVHARVYDTNSGIESVTLSHRYSTDNVTWSDWVNATMKPAEGDNFTGTIPALSIGTYVQYQISAKDYSDNTAVNSNAGEYFVYTVIPEFPSAITLPLFMAATIAAATLLKKRMRYHHREWRRTRNNSMK
jgi:hypothetical protein